MFNYNFVIVALGCLLLGMAAPLMGTFAFLRKKSLLSDSLAHALLPGLCIAFLLSSVQNTFVLLIGAIISAWFADYCIRFIERNSKLSADAAMSIVLSSFFALGIVLLTNIQQQSSASQAGLDSFLFGKAAAISLGDVHLYLVLSLVLLLVVLLFYRPFSIYLFDYEYAVASGMPVKKYNMLLSVFTIVAIAMCMQALGVVLTTALLVIPVSAARLLSYKLTSILLIASLIGGISGVGGALISSSLYKMPTGPWIVVCLFFFLLLSAIVKSSQLFTKKKITQL
jgi:manganese/zinc/iron transport system permease protein